MRNLSFIAAVAATYISTTVTASAGVHAALASVPEPGILPLMAMGAALTIIAYRIRKKK